MAKDLESRISQLPLELNRLVFAYIPNRLPFKEELLKKIKSEWYEDCEYSYPPHHYRLKKLKSLLDDMGLTLHFCVWFPDTNPILSFYWHLHRLYLKDLKEIAKNKKIKGRSKLKTHHDFISAFLKNDL